MEAKDELGWLHFDEKGDEKRGSGEEALNEFTDGGKKLKNFTRMYKNPRLSSRFECSNNTDSIHNSLTLLCGARSVQHDAAPRALQVCVCEQSSKSFSPPPCLVYRQRMRSQV